ncbi:MAG: type III-B CRISPR module-associated protein Cmr5 [Candidatus Cloacimonetes bacterium]|nr:type III-B CRISPR module-associated protein Cmr5 [Candidatus Cloacimonadota bacterium]
MSQEFIKGIENGRASFAYECANSVNSELKKAYKSHVKSFPMMVKTNGLGSAIAFLFSKKDKEKHVYETVGTHIVKWLIQDDKYKIYNLVKFTDLKGLVANITSLNSSQYRALTIEVLSFFKWLRRFADGLYEGEDDE